MAKYTRLGDLLIDAGVITDGDLQHALDAQKGTKKRLGEVLIDEGIISEMQLIEALQMQLGIDFIELSKIEIPSEMTSVLPKSVAKKYGCVPVRIQGDTLFLAMSDPLNFIAIEEVKSLTKRRVVPMIATMESVEREIEMLYGNERARRAIEEMRDESLGADIDTAATRPNLIGEEDASTAPAVRLVNSIIERAIVERASDIHMEPQSEEMVIRMRVDGILHTTLTVPKDLEAAVTARIKVMCNMDITERRVPQDGRAAVRVKLRQVDLRASTLPTLYGEKIVIRVLERDANILTPEGIGLAGDNLDKYNRLMQNKQGVVLLVGPTGSGKSSTMYTMISQLNTEDVNLVTLEDPVEYDIDGVNQVQINEKVGMTFASGLKSILRQDPDIIAVGEINEHETAETAMRAAITGHLVLSTLHTNDAPTAVGRLIDLGVEPYMVATALKGVISQRLVRRICPYCKEEYYPDASELDALGLDGKNAGKLTLFRGKGCPECFGTGYRGRIAAFEILNINADVRAAIHEDRGNARFMKAVEDSGYTTMRDNVNLLVLNGVTSAEEALRTVNRSE